MKTLYGELPESMLVSYMDELTNGIFKILPMREELCPTLSKYIESLLRELHGGENLIHLLSDNANYLKLMNTLQNLLVVDDLEIYRSDVFKCLSIVKKIRSSLEEVIYNELP